MSGIVEPSESRPPALRRHQREALESLARPESTDGGRAWVVLPPGAGKTRVGIEYAQDLLSRGEIASAVAFGPNTAIQTQWANAWDDAADPSAENERAGTDRDLGTVFTALTYQSLAVFSDDRTGAGLDDLHESGRMLVDRLRTAGRVLLVLDECHHLLEVWGRLLGELLEELPEARVLGLTATPPETLTEAQAELVEHLFSDVRYAASIPAVVREGDLAPFADLVWLTQPTREESEWLAAQSVRFTELTTAVLQPEYGTVSFLSWLDRRFMEPLGETLRWDQLVRAQPTLTDAVLRMHHAGLVAAPRGAVPSEAHRRGPDAEDWAELIGDWMRGHLLASGDPADTAVAESIRQALPAVGYQFTRAGIRRGRSPVDRVLSRSAAKPEAAVQIAGAESRSLGERLRLLVLCDFESSTATLSADLRQVLDEQSGSALLVLERLLADPETAQLDPVLVSGKTVAAARDVLAALREEIGADDPELAAQLVIEESGAGVSLLQGPWTSRRWVPAVTRFFAAGGSRVVVGTRGLLGEGWDAPAITGLIDLTTATTATAVTQTRGRALRTDPGWPEKVALTWTVVCAAADLPRGDQDWQRLVRKHDGFFGTDSSGQVVDGVAHIDPEFSPYAPPAADEFEAINARMLVRAQARTEIRERWQVGAPYRDEALRMVRITGGREGRGVPPGSGPADADDLAAVRPRHAEGDPGAPLPLRPASVKAVAARAASPARLPLVLPALLAALSVVWALLLGGPVSTTAAWILTAACALSIPVGLVLRGTARRRLYAAPPTVGEVAGALADALHATGGAPVGSERVRIRVDAQGGYSCRLETDPASAEVFALALDELLSPIAQPRYLIARWSLDPPEPGPAGWWAAARTGMRRDVAEGEAYHAVPAVLGARKELAQAFAVAWDRWVGGGAPVFTGRPEGAGLLTAQRGADPMAVTSVLRTTWH